MRADPQTELIQLRARVVTLEAALLAAQQENTLLRQKVDALVRRVFGASSEALDPAQLELVLADGHLAAATPVAQLRAHRAGPRLRAARRAHQSRPIIERLHQALVRLKASGRHFPQSLLDQAIDYTLGQWPTLTIFLHDGRVEIDNNLVENAFRPAAIGKRNWLFIGDAEAGERSAIIYTVIESCRRGGIVPCAYLRDVLTRLPTMTNRQIHEVTPEAWAKAQRAAARPAAS